MPVQSPAKPTSVLHEILAWSKGRPAWQQDALRRIIVNGTIGSSDLNELEALCKAVHFPSDCQKSMVHAQPLEAAHLPPAPGAEASVSLVSIGALHHVNRLPSTQSLPFGPSPGLTVIYGDNGSGKSGYARVLKKACRARGAPPVIRDDIFATSPPAKASATIIFRVGGVDVSVTWMDGSPSDSRLANVFVFDASSATHYLQDDSSAAFTPFGLDVLPSLSKACDTIGQRLKEEIGQAKSAIAGTIANWKCSPTTEVGKMVAGLSAKTTVKGVDGLSELQPKQEQRLQELREALKSDPIQKAKQTRAAAARLDAFAAKLLVAAEELGKEKVDHLRKLMDEVADAEVAARSFASGRFEGAYLTGTGSRVWRSLWDAANEFSISHAYVGEAFPFIGDKARCVLCQQDLDEGAVERLTAFDSFCKDKSQEVAAEVAMQLKEAAEELEALNALGPELIKIEADLAGFSPEQSAILREYVKRADERLEVIKRSVVDKAWNSTSDLPRSPHPALKDLCTALEARAKTEESAQDPETRKILEAELAELADREWLAGARGDVLAAIERYKTIQRLEACLKDTVTTSITTKSKDLTDQFITKAYCVRFGKEVRDLGLCTLDVKLDAIQGKKGETKFGLRLSSAGERKVLDIASEGEERCVALAAFLAELSQASHLSSLVFDDPVSSLDHPHREGIALRLIRESRTRQVIVFTHDVVFLNDLQSYALRNGSALETLHLEWEGRVPGHCVRGLPWDLKTVDDRFDRLEKEQRAIEKSWNPVPSEGNIHAIRQAYSWLRATLERIVEKEIFADVVFRFRSYVNLKNLDKAIGFEMSECKELKRLVQRCHDVTEAHDTAQGKQAAVPKPADLATDISAARMLVVNIRKRRKTTPATINSSSQGSQP
jgi:energy-coupling factor transporter ATP-binding protein EcfA2